MKPYWINLARTAAVALAAIAWTAPALAQDAYDDEIADAIDGGGPRITPRRGGRPELVRHGAC